MTFGGNLNSYSVRFYKHINRYVLFEFKFVLFFNYSYESKNNVRTFEICQKGYLFELHMLQLVKGGRTFVC